MVANTKQYPMVFTFPQVIVGNGFSARVEIHGRALLVEDDGDVWIHGVQPGGFAGGGESYGKACHEFRVSYQSVLYDIAQEAQSFDGFRAQIEEFFSTVNDAYSAEWELALSAVRKNDTALAGFNKVPAESRPVKIKVTQLDNRSMRPDLNQFDKFEIAQDKAA